MDRLGPRALSCGEHARLVQVALSSRPRTDEVRIVGGRDVKRAAVDLGIDGNRGDAQCAQGEREPYAYLATVCHEDFREGRHAQYSPCTWHWPTGWRSPERHRFP